MLGLYFGNYLWENNIIAKTDMDDAANMPYPEFMQKLAEKNCLSPTEAERYLAGYKEESSLRDEDIEAISSGDIGRIVPAFIDFYAPETIDKKAEPHQNKEYPSDKAEETLTGPDESGSFIPDFIQSDLKRYNRYVTLTVECISRFISNKIVLKKARRVQTYDFEYLACQELKGAHHIFLGLSGKEDCLLFLANRFAGKEFSAMSQSAYDGVCEFINSINGLFASELSNEKVIMDIMLPCHYTNKSISSNDRLCCLPVVIDGKGIEIVFSFDADLIIT